MELHPYDPIIFAGTLDGAVRGLDLRSGESIAEYSGENRVKKEFELGNRFFTCIFLTNENFNGYRVELEVNG